APLGELLRALRDGTISGTAAKQVFEEMIATKQAPAAIIAARGLAQVSDTAALAAAVDAAIAEHPAEVEKYRAGKAQVLGFFVGKVMKAMKGRANPQVVNELVLERLRGNP